MKVIPLPKKGAPMVSITQLRSKVSRRLLEATHQLESLVVRRRLNGRMTVRQSEILSDLRSEGVHVTTVDQLLPSDSAASWDRSFRLARNLLLEAPLKEPSRLWRRGSASNDLRADVMLDMVPELYLLGLDPGILALVQQYLCLPVAYHGAVIRHSLVDGVGAGPRLWHQDEEDFHVVRMVVYLNDVTLGGGPFEYIPRSLGIRYKQFTGCENEITDERMRQVVPLERWKRVYGAAGTVVLCDTAQVFHHESLQTERDRAVIMIGYSSRRPKSMVTSMGHFPAEEVEETLRRIVPTANYPHVFAWRKAAYGHKTLARRDRTQGNAA
jgi:hypothetical protein